MRQLVFLSCEGAETEPSYFKNMNRHLRDAPGGGVFLHVLKHPHDGLSSVDAVYELLEECQKLREDEKLIPDSAYQELLETFDAEEIERIVRGDLSVDRQRKRRFLDALLSQGINLHYRQYLKDSTAKDDDRFAIVLDRDMESHTLESLERILQKSRDRGYICCLTNPCFEFWLLLHLVDVKALVGSAELSRLRDNKKISRMHTYVSRKVSEIAGHAKRISARSFDVHYWQSLEKALLAARAFATKNEDILCQVGTSLPDLIAPIFHSLQIKETE